MINRFNGQQTIWFREFTLSYQLIDLLLNEDWSTYFADHGSTSSKYSRVNPYVVAKLLEK